MVNSQSVWLVVYVNDTTKRNRRKMTFVRQIGPYRSSADRSFLVVRILRLHLTVTGERQLIGFASSRKTVVGQRTIRATTCIGLRLALEYFYATSLTERRKSYCVVRMCCAQGYHINSDVMDGCVPFVKLVTISTRASSTAFAKFSLPGSWPAGK